MNWRFLNNKRICEIIINSVNIFSDWMKVFFGDFKDYNYIEFYNWISIAIITLLGLLTVFLSTHYQENIIKVKQLLFDFKFEILGPNDFKKRLHQYEYMTKRSMKLYIDSVNLFSKISIFTIFVWGISTLVYLLRVSSIGGKIILITSFFFLVYVLNKICKMFQDLKSEKEIVPFESLLDITKYNEFYSDKLLFWNDIMQPAFEIKVSKVDTMVSIKYLSLFHYYNYIVAIQLKKTNFILELVCELKNNKNILLKGFELENIYNKASLNKELISNMLSDFQSIIYIKTKDWCSYQAKIEQINNENHCILAVKIGKKTSLPIPSDLESYVTNVDMDRVNYRII